MSFFGLTPLIVVLLRPPLEGLQLLVNREAKKKRIKLSSHLYFHSIIFSFIKKIFPYLFDIRFRIKQKSIATDVG